MQKKNRVTDDHALDKLVACTTQNLSLSVLKRRQS